MCTINSQKITVASKCSQQTAVKISYHLNMHNILYKNDKLARSILVKIVNPIKKFQRIDYIFFLDSYQCHTTIQNTQQQNLSENTFKLNYRAIIFLLHISIQNWASPNIPTVQEYQLYPRKHNGQAQSIYLNAFINLIR